MNYAIIAAGQGSRLAQEGANVPKPLVTLNGEPLIGRLLRIFTQNNAESISVIVNEEAKEVRSYLESLAVDCLRIDRDSHLVCGHFASICACCGSRCGTCVEHLHNKERR